MSPPPDLFAVLGLPRRQDLDPAELERRFHARAREVHPDRFARAAPRDRRRALEESTRLNAAYRTLRSPRSRAAHLLVLAGVDPGAPAHAPGPDFLEEQLEAREALAVARRSGDAPRATVVAAKARARLEAVDAELARLLSGPAPDAAALGAAARALARARYHEALLEDAGAPAGAGGR